MKPGLKAIGIGAIGIALFAGLVLFAGYELGLRQSVSRSSDPTAAPRGVEAASSATPAPQPLRTAAMPSNHPPLPENQSGPSPAVAPRDHLASRTASTGNESPQASPPSHTSFTHFRVGQRNVKRILADGDLMWVGTSGGVVRYDSGRDEYRLFDTSSGLLSNGIFHVGKIDDRIVVGTYGGGMALFDPTGEKWRVYNVPDGLADAFVYDVLNSDNGDIWIATWSGANRVLNGNLDDPTQWELYTVANTDGGLLNDWVYAIDQDDEGAIWLATEGGLVRYHNGAWSNWRHKDGLGAPYEQVRDQIAFKNDPAQYSAHHARQKTEMGLQEVEGAYNPNYIVALLVDRHGTVWCGTWGGGLSRFDGEHWQVYTMAHGLPSNHIFALHEDPQGVLWVGTGNGLARRLDDGFKTYTVSDGLFSNTVFAIETAPDGSAWIGSFGGVAHIVGLE